MYVIFLEYTDIYDHLRLIDEVCFTTYEKAEEYLLQDTKNYKQNGNEYEINRITYYIEKLEIIS